MRRAVSAAFHYSAPALIHQFFNRGMQSRRVRPHNVKGDAPIRVNQISRVGKPAVNLMRPSLKVVNQNRIRNRFFLFEPFAVAPFLLEAVISFRSGSGMRLTD